MRLAPSAYSVFCRGIWASLAACFRTLHFRLASSCRYLAGVHVPNDCQNAIWAPLPGGRARNQHGPLHLRGAGPLLFLPAHDAPKRARLWAGTLSDPVDEVSTACKRLNIQPPSCLRTRLALLEDPRIGDAETQRMASFGGGIRGLP